MRIWIKKILNALQTLGNEKHHIDTAKNESAAENALPSHRPDDCMAMLQQLGVDKAHYGCGPKLLGEGWINVDFTQPGIKSTKAFILANLASKHPFASDYFKFAFAEDFIEHLEQAASIIFLSEAYRTLRPGGVLRLSSPGLKGVLNRHFHSACYEGAAKGMEEAYSETFA